MSAKGQPSDLKLLGDVAILLTPLVGLLMMLRALWQLSKAPTRR